MQGNTETVNVCTAEATEDMTNGEVFETLKDGDKILWDGRKQPLTVKAGYSEGDDDTDFVPPIMVEGPQGGEKMLNQNKHNADRICADSFSLSGSGTWISNLRVTERAE